MHMLLLGAVPAPGGDCKAVAVWHLPTGCPRVHSVVCKGKPSYCSVVPLILCAFYCHPIASGVGRNAEQHKAGGLRAGPPARRG